MFQLFLRFIIITFLIFFGSCFSSETSEIDIHLKGGVEIKKRIKGTSKLVPETFHYPGAKLLYEVTFSNEGFYKDEEAILVYEFHSLKDTDRLASIKHHTLSEVLSVAYKLDKIEAYFMSQIAKSKWKIIQYQRQSHSNFPSSLIVIQVTRKRIMSIVLKVSDLTSQEDIFLIQFFIRPTVIY